MELGRFEPLAIALGLGLLVGMQREWKTAQIAGIRTFPLITILGSLSAILASTFSAWVLAAGFLAVTAMLFVGNLANFKNEAPDPGLTTEMAALVMFGVGAALVEGFTAEAVVVSGVVAVLLHWKEPLHDFVGKIGESDFKAIIQLVLIGLVILPVLPNQTYGWYDVLNPYKLWLMVVLISGISLTAYIAYELLGPRAGVILGGILGGLISSTATTVSFSRQTKAQHHVAPMALVVIMIASTILFGRILFEIGIVAPKFLPSALAPLGIIMGLMVILCVVLFLWVRRGELVDNPTHDNPAQLKAAVIFGGLYAVILLAVAAAKVHFGTGGMYLVAILSGLTDMDAITLSTAELVKVGHVTADTGWRVILTAALSNLMFKGGVVALLGSRRLLISILIPFAISMAGGVLLLAFWPN
jgi:uncharacterized membrane protein (DUF4010 family)